jgi:hypothetical protein
MKPNQRATLCGGFSSDSVQSSFVRCARHHALLLYYHPATNNTARGPFNNIVQRPRRRRQRPVYIYCCSLQRSDGRNLSLGCCSLCGLYGIVWWRRNHSVQLFIGRTCSPDAHRDAGIRPIPAARLPDRPPPPVFWPGTRIIFYPQSELLSTPQAVFAARCAEAIHAAGADDDNNNNGSRPYLR